MSTCESEDVINPDNLFMCYSDDDITTRKASQFADGIEDSTVTDGKDVTVTEAEVLHMVEAEMIVELMLTITHHEMKCMIATEIIHYPVIEMNKQETSGTDNPIYSKTVFP